MRRDQRHAAALKLGTDAGHLIVRKDDVLCSVCGERTPVHAGDGTPLPALLLGYKTVIERHPAEPHDRIAPLYQS